MPALQEVSWRFLKRWCRKRFKNTFCSNGLMNYIHRNRPLMPPRISSLVLFILVFACKSGKPKKLQDTDLTVSEFISLAAQVSYPFYVNDTLLNKKSADSLLINTTTFSSFLPDSVFKRFYPQSKNLKLYLCGKAHDEEKGDYIIIKSVLMKNSGAHIFFFNKKANYEGGMKLGDNKLFSTPAKYARIDNRFNIALVEEKKTSTGEAWTNETIYFLDNEDRLFRVAMTNSTEDLSDEIMGNPIDTLPRKNKLSADYSIDKKNLVSIRDGTSEKTFRFFIHFSKQNNECVGEIKGEGEWLEKNKGIYREPEGGCGIEFDFSSATVTIKEVSGCGQYRDITCFYEGTYTKKKEVTKPKEKEKAKKQVVSNR